VRNPAKNFGYSETLGDILLSKHYQVRDEFMNIEDLKSKVQDIVKRANALRVEYLGSENTPVNYACIFSQSHDEYETLMELAGKIGKVIKKTPTGLLYQINPLDTVAGKLQLLKIRIPDPTRPELGDADFTITNFPAFEKKYLSQPQFTRMDKPDFYMIELMDPNYDVRAYFSNPPLDQELGIV